LNELSGSAFQPAGQDKSVCYLCHNRAVTLLLDCGRQPICNRYLAAVDQNEYTHPFLLGQCNVCGLAQLIGPGPASSFTPPYDWIIYTEPEKHLEQLADTISHLVGITNESVICGLSFLDEPLLERLRRRGLERVWRIDLQRDLHVNKPKAGIETIQECLNPDTAKSISEQRGKPNDVVLAAYIVEHAHNLTAFIASLRELMTPQGYVVVQVPDTKRIFERFDYTALWEEHVLYFTAETLRACFLMNGFSSVEVYTFKYELEDCLVAIASGKDGGMTSDVRAPLADERRRAVTFAREFAPQRQRTKSRLQDFKNRSGPIALFGAGHRACMFVNLMGIGDYLEFVVDDDPHKQGYLMPGSWLPIHKSARLAEKEIKLCLLGLSPESEEKVIANNRGFLQRGGVFQSIFPDSKYAFAF